MPYANGKIPNQYLAAIPGGYLEGKAAMSWIAMSNYISYQTSGRVQIMPNGSKSSYRPIWMQQYFWNIYQNGGNLAAKVGYSNHGLGIVVDVATMEMASLINKYGARFGWQKKWSDAPGEWWHFKWSAGNANISDINHWLLRGPNYPTLQKGYYVQAYACKRLQSKLHKLKLTDQDNGIYNIWTRRAVRKFQKQTFGRKGVDGIAGKQTWRRLILKTN